MVKHDDPESGASARADHRVASDQRVEELERRLAKARAVEAKRAHKLERAQRRGAPHAIRVARRRKLKKARARGDRIERKLARAQSSAAAASASVSGASPGLPAQPAGDTAVDVPGPPEGADPRLRAYCLRERQTIVMVEPRHIVMRNGRPALTGLCPSCGARVTRPIKASSG